MLNRIGTRHVRYERGDIVVNTRGHLISANRKIKRKLNDGYFAFPAKNII